MKNLENRRQLQLSLRSEAAPVRRTRIRRLSQTKRNLKVVGLFAGVGGLERGLQQAGHSTKLLCELDAGAAAVLRARFLTTPLVGDIRDLTSLPPRTSLLVAGFPCQDLSQAGRTNGINGSKSGLVQHVLRLVRSSGVENVLLENVPFMLRLARGRAMSVLVQEFERLGYEWAYRVVDTRAFGLPQRRRRVFFLASTRGTPWATLLAQDARPEPDPSFDGRVACGFYWTEGNRGLGWAVNSVPTLKGGSGVGVPSPPAAWFPGEGIFTPTLPAAERLQGFPVNWTASATEAPGVNDRHRWKLVGNAVSVPVARWLGEQLARPADPNRLRLPAVRPLTRKDPWPDAAWSSDQQRFTADISAWPKNVRRPDLSAFLADDRRELSSRATEGFLKRLLASSLRRDPRFERGLKTHLARMSRA